ncbi:MAG TPA: hypothetical protein VFI25_18995 [Planctomycetota bacterium]|jgi:hypothetical protein|nr:hypothetical protein [Planctomycetota bacterium]
MRRALALLSLAYGAAPLMAQTTWIVDSAGGGQFTDIPPAIAAASPGDRIVVVGAGPYSAFVLDKGLDIEAVASAFTPRIEVVGVPAGQRARVAGFRLQIQPGPPQVSVDSCLGGVSLVDLQEVGPLSSPTIGPSGLVIVDSPRVLVDQGVFVGQAGTVFGGVGLYMDNSRAALRDATFKGGVTVSTFASSGNDGEAGAALYNGSDAFASGVVVIGGNSSSGTLIGGNGGYGLFTDATSAAVVVGSSHLEATPGGGGIFIPGSPGQAALGNVQYTLDCTIIGPVTATSIPSRPGLTMPTSLPVGTNLTTAVQGGPGEFVWLAFDLAHDYVPFPALGGAIVLTPNFILAGGVLLDGAGSGSLSFSVPNIPSAQNLDVIGQGLALVAGAWVLTAPDQTRTE